MNAISPNHITSFSDAMTTAGLSGCGIPVDDGQLHRFKIEGDKAGSENGWYVLYGGEVPAGAFGCWKRDIQERWCSTTRKSLNPSARKQYDKQLRQAKTLRLKEEKRKNEEAARACSGIWERANTEIDGDYPYLAKKQVNAYGLKEYKGRLLVPVCDAEGHLWSLQFIDKEGEKRFKAGGKKKGCFHLIGSPDSPLYLCEGYATGATVHEVTGKPVAVAFDSGNLLEVAKEIKAHYPEVEIIIAADNDHLDKRESLPDGKALPSYKNAGIVAAVTTSQKSGVLMAYPHFMQNQDMSDFNDLYVDQGAEAVIKALSDTTDGFSPVNPYAGYENKQLPPDKVNTAQAGANSCIPDDSNVELSLFDVRDQGVYYAVVGQSMKISSRLDVTAKTRDSENGQWGRLLEWHDDDGKLHQWAMPMEMLAGNGEDLRKTLLRGGLPFITSNNKGKRLLQDYISTQEVKARARCVSMTGWHGKAFVLPDQVIGDQTNEKVILQTSAGEYNHFKQAGTLEEWQQQIGRYCIGNSRLAFAASMAFAAPLMSLVGAEGGGFNFRGDSAEGKSTALQVACSVCGGRDYLHTWRATGNGLEGTAVNHNDALLALDEMDEADGAEVGNIAYMLANGMGKQRADRDGGTKLKKQWRTLFISSGESSLAEHMRSSGKQAKAGQEIRLADIPMNTGGPFKGFEAVHDLGGGAALANYLKEQTANCYGAPLRAYLQSLAGHREEAASQVRVIRDRFIQEMVPAGADGQVSRVAARFGLIAAGGELASQYQVTGWPIGEAENAARICFKAWLEHRGGTGSIEDKRLMEQVSGFFQSHGQSRFAAWDIRGAEKIHNRAGYVLTREGETTFLIFTQVFREEICRGYNPKRAVTLLKERGWLKMEGKNSTVPKTPPGEKTIRFYVVKSDVLGGE